MPKKLTCLIVLIQSTIIFKLGKSKLNFWDWLLERIQTDIQSSFRINCIVKFLFIDSINRNEKVRYCYIYEEYISKLAKNKLPVKYYSSLFNAAIEHNNRNLAYEIKKIIDHDPEYFPISFRKTFKAKYKNVFG